MQLYDIHAGMFVTLKPAEELRKLPYVVSGMTKYAGQTFEVRETNQYHITLKGMDSWAWGADAFVDENNAILPEISEDDLMELIGNG